MATKAKAMAATAMARRFVKPPHVAIGNPILASVSLARSGRGYNGERVNPLEDEVVMEIRCPSRPSSRPHPYKIPYKRLPYKKRKKKAVKLRRTRQRRNLPRSSLLRRGVAMKGGIPCR
jgi:hypothetical protein